MKSKKILTTGGTEDHRDKPTGGGRRTEFHRGYAPAGNNAAEPSFDFAQAAAILVFAEPPLNGEGIVESEGIPVRDLRDHQ